MNFIVTDMDGHYRCGKFNVVITDGELEYLKSFFKDLGMYLR